MIKVLDHGYVRLIDHMGDDNALAEHARMSTDTEGDPDKNARLLERLIRDRHTSPIEFGQMIFEVQCPIFVMRQWIRHRTGAFNEFSARYTEMPDLFYIPSTERCQAQSTFNKQGSAEALPVPLAEKMREGMADLSNASYIVYSGLVEAGLTRELARIVLPVNIYTKFRWTVNLHNLFHFLKLREDPHAQWEIREFARVIHQLVAEQFPKATEAFENHIQNQVVISANLAKILAEALHRADDGSFTSEEQEFIRRNFNG